VGVVGFERLGFFGFSPVEVTGAGALRPAVPAATAKRRADALMRIQKTLSSEYHRSLRGKVMQVLVDGTDRRRGLRVGRTQGDAPEIDAAVWVRGRAVPGRIVPVRIESSSAYDLTGTVVSPASRREARGLS
ncbi:MAG: TRAM domain-containing protein, partial [bacterium]|nr:TRAM domain-containing protein [bacterium]